MTQNNNLRAAAARSGCGHEPPMSPAVCCCSGFGVPESRPAEI
jgi:hypothetical protein